MSTRAHLCDTCGHESCRKRVQSDPNWQLYGCDEYYEDSGYHHVSPEFVAEATGDESKRGAAIVVALAVLMAMAGTLADCARRLTG